MAAEVKVLGKVLLREPIRDTVVHISDIEEWLEQPALTIWISNACDQPVTVQVKGNRLPSRLGAVNVGSSFTMAADSQDARTLTPNTTGWLPYILVEVSYATAPTRGVLTVLAYKKP